MPRNVTLASCLALASCAGLSPTVLVDRQIGEWADVQAQADRECGRAGYARGQFLHWRDSDLPHGGPGFSFGFGGRATGDQRYGEFICRRA